MAKAFNVAFCMARIFMRNKDKAILNVEKVGKKFNENSEMRPTLQISNRNQHRYLPTELHNYEHPRIDDIFKNNTVVLNKLAEWAKKLRLTDKDIVIPLHIPEYTKGLADHLTKCNYDVTQMFYIPNTISNNVEHQRLDNFQLNKEKANKYVQLMLAKQREECIREIITWPGSQQIWKDNQRPNKQETSITQFKSAGKPYKEMKLMSSKSQNFKNIDLHDMKHKINMREIQYSSQSNRFKYKQTTKANRESQNTNEKPSVRLDDMKLKIVMRDKHENTIARYVGKYCNNLNKKYPIMNELILHTRKGCEHSSKITRNLQCQFISSNGKYITANCRCHNCNLINKLKHRLVKKTK